ncbi:hypothetical protein K443DRAFT_448195 [Laccaria amethystina LaAM-08-1]|jgi:hypothetical protein|uniref:Uncharacterized protein n=1 Tax=Laccaria amethystina LaAM-08-1 TaxID=1095629 RepID=A0A0C9XVS7_9AGAR|nr:hypothetical protein K443DRAFT_448195 [Laccaria amethystina LaAM-08-1]
MLGAPTFIPLTKSLQLIVNGNALPAIALQITIPHIYQHFRSRRCPGSHRDLRSNSQSVQLEFSFSVFTSLAPPTEWKPSLFIHDSDCMELILLRMHELFIDQEDRESRHTPCAHAHASHGRLQNVYSATLFRRYD